MNNLEQVSKLVEDLGLKPIDVVRYWQDAGLLPEHNRTHISIPKYKEISENTERRVKQIIGELASKSIDEITDYALLEDDLLFDSLDTLELIMNLETELKIEVSDDELGMVKTVKDVVQLAANHL